MSINFLKNNRKQTVVQLNWKAFFKEQKKRQEKMKKVEDGNPDVFMFEVPQLLSISTKDGDRLAKERSDSFKLWVEGLKKDAYVNESLLVLNDMSKTSKKKDQ